MGFPVFFPSWKPLFVSGQYLYSKKNPRRARATHRLHRLQHRQSGAGGSQLLRMQLGLVPQALVRELLMLGLVPWLVHVRGHMSEHVRAHALEHDEGACVGAREGAHVGACEGARVGAREGAGTGIGVDRAIGIGVGTSGAVAVWRSKGWRYGRRRRRR